MLFRQLSQLQLQLITGEGGVHSGGHEGGTHPLPAHPGRHGDDGFAAHGLPVGGVVQVKVAGGDGVVRLCVGQEAAVVEEAA